MGFFNWTFWNILANCVFTNQIIHNLCPLWKWLKNYSHSIYVKGSYWFLSDVYLGLIFFIQNKNQQMLDMDPILELWFMSSRCKLRIINISHKLNLQHSFLKCKTTNYNFPLNQYIDYGLWETGISTINISISKLNLPALNGWTFHF